ncbi:MAG TPA: wax ester/triacylglycerol synthase family O-acyltransferase [Jatrophihabitans sp.]|nr:wax ester/triacylglycerol synthase family O-acyltransferase [Jatrophihabitans sp.]
MSERMSAADAAVLLRESRTAPQHVGGLAVFAAPPGGFDYERLVRLLEERISHAPRYRQKVRSVLGHLAHPVWIDDPTFDITYHVRRSTLPRPGTEQQLLDFAARIQARPLDRAHPLWEMYLVEGLEGEADRSHAGRVAIATKTHAALVGEPDGIDLTQVILDAARAPRRTVEPIWMPEPEPTNLALVGDAVRDVLRRPTALTYAARVAAQDARTAAARVTGARGGVFAMAGGLLHRGSADPLRVEPGEQRRLAVARTRLDDYRQVRDAFGAAVNDVALAVVAGALRGWLLARAVPLRPATSMHALLPVSVADASGADEMFGAARGNPSGAGKYPMSTIGRVRPVLVELPVGEPDPLVRLAQLRYAMATHRASGDAVRAHRLVGLSGFAPPTVHALGARAASERGRRSVNLVVTNVPGPQVPLYAAGARMIEIFPVQPLLPGHALSIALTSYDGGVYYGLNGDWAAMRDIGLLSDLIEESLGELVTAAPRHSLGRASRPRRRRNRPAAREELTPRGPVST